LDKNFLAQEAMEWTMESNQELLVLLLDMILVANQVMLASLWYISTCWNADPRMCHHLYEVLLNFISESNLKKARAKVWWDSLAI
jgi:hypothetical protein